jgi:hypothetical protein
MFALIRGLISGANGMPKKAKTPSARLSHWQEIVSQGNPFELPTDWSDQTVWTEAARDALNLDEKIDDKGDIAIRKAFENFKLDPRNPFNWRRLLSFYVQAHVSRGQPKKWNSERLCELLRNISDARQNRPKAKRSEIYRSLIKKPPYKGKSESYLKHGHRLALDPKHNEILRINFDRQFQDFIDITRWQYREKGMAVPLPVEQEIKSFALNKALKAIGAPNSSW